MVEEASGPGDAVTRLVARARGWLDENQYMTLATSDPNGSPWASTVWFAVHHLSRSPEGLHVELLWLSRPEAQHSQNLDRRPELGISIFDSTQPAGTGDGLQLAAHAELVPSPLLDDRIAVFSDASLAAGGTAWSRARVEGPDAVLRLYVAHVERAFILSDGTRLELPLT